MADLSDVSNALVQLAAATVYPNGTTQASVGACDIIVYAGWPNPQTLDGDLGCGKVHISVYPRPGDTITSVMMGDTDWEEISNDGTSGTAAREVERTTKQFQIIVWSADPLLRDAIAKPIDLAIKLTTRMTLADGSQAVMNYHSQTQMDEQQKVLIYRRDFFVSVNYAAVQTETDYTIKHTVTDTTGENAVGDAGPTISLTSPRT